MTKFLPFYYSAFDTVVRGPHRSHRAFANMQPLEYVLVMLCGVLHLGATAAAYGYTSSPVERTSTSPAPRACGECDMRRCPPVNNCPGRLAKDDCNCCFTCYKPPDATTKASKYSLSLEMMEPSCFKSQINRRNLLHASNSVLLGVPPK